MIKSAFFQLVASLGNSTQQAVNKLIECAVERHDCEIRDKLQGILDSHGEQASVELHKSCYCLYTS